MKDLVICGVAPGKDVNPLYTHACTFNDLVTLLQNLITDLVIISTFLATAAFAYAGFILLTSGGSEGKKDEAKKIFTKVLIGYLWILGAWLLVYTITSVLLKSGYSLLGAPK
ncbi:MAG: pilin [bacterium]|nr:pilin [bacterium]